VMVSSGGAVVLTESTIERIGQAGVQALEDGILEMVNVTVSDCGAGLMGTGFKGFVRNSSFKGCRNCGVQLTDVSGFNAIDSAFSENDRIGAVFRDSCDARFVNCTFDDNRQSGIDVQGEGCAPVLAGCSFSGNGVGGHIHDGAAPQFVGGKFAKNESLGLCVTAATATGDALDISGSQRGAVSVMNGAVVTLTRSKLHHITGATAQVTDSDARLVLEHTHVADGESVHLFVGQGGIVHATH